MTTAPYTEDAKRPLGAEPIVDPATIEVVKPVSSTTDTTEAASSKTFSIGKAKVTVGDFSESAGDKPTGAPADGNDSEAPSGKTFSIGKVKVTVGKF
ncbi:hypothetical protein HDU79_010925 [Rhizoclosmatium sp. JEL0117]|nr:hypothetical protein HDU79_010925 [Rhizoclosmatium sp. JEL0117]